MPSFSNTMRFTGFSGIDTDSMVRQIMQAESMRLHTMQRQRQRLQWQQQDLRGVTSSLLAFQNRFLSMSGSDAIHASGNMSGRTATVNGPGVTASANNTARPGSWRLDTHAVADNARITGAPVDTNITANARLNLANVGVDDTIRISVNNGASREINIGQMAQQARDGGGTTAEQQARFLEDLNTKLGEEFGTTTVGTRAAVYGDTAYDPNAETQVQVPNVVNRVEASLIDGRMSFTTNGTNSMTLTTGHGSGLLNLGGIASGSTNSLATTTSLSQFLGSSFFNQAGQATININGTNVNLQSDMTIAEMMEAVNSNTDATMSFNALNSTFSITSATTGSQARVELGGDATTVAFANRIGITDIEADRPAQPAQQARADGANLRNQIHATGGFSLAAILEDTVTDLTVNPPILDGPHAMLNITMQNRDGSPGFTGGNINLTIIASESADNDDFIERTNAELARMFGRDADGNNNVFARIDDDGNLVFDSTEARRINVSSGASLETSQRLGFGNSLAGSGLNNNLKNLETVNARDFFGDEFFGTDDDGEPLQSALITINGTNINITDSMSLDDVFRLINTTPGGAQASIDPVTGQFSITSRGTGNNATVTFGDNDATNAFLDRLGIEERGTIRGTDATEAGGGGATARGENARVTLTGPDGQAVDIERETNEFNLGSEIGLNFSVNSAAVGETVVIEVATNNERTREVITNFVEEYNALVRELSELRNTARPRGSNNQVFDPLLDHERAEMSDSEIRQWEERAREGMLHRSQEIEFALTQMRRAMHEGIEVDGRRMHLFEFGITMETSGNVATLSLDEDRMEAAIREMPGDTVLSFFGGLQSNLNEAINRSEERIRSVAGTSNIEVNTTIFNQIRDIDRRVGSMEDRLRIREQALFSMFGRLEAAIMRSDTQMEMLWQMSGM